MALSSVDICNIALSRIGNSGKIASFTEQSKEASICKLHYQYCLDWLLESFPWGFAKKTIVLAQLAEDAPEGWTYIYQYPSDCVKARAVVDSGGERYAIRAAYLYDDDPERIHRSSVRYPFEIRLRGDGNARCIVTDLEAARLLYTARVSDTTLFPAQFSSLLATKVAGEIATGLLADANIVKVMEQRFVQQWREATAMSINEGRQDEEADSISVRVR